MTDIGQGPGRELPNETDGNARQISEVWSRLGCSGQNVSILKRRGTFSIFLQKA